MSSDSIEVTLESLALSEEQFYQLCQNNRDLRFERTAQGDVIIMSPTGGETSDRNSEINFQLRLWNKQSKLGKVFDSSGGFTLPNGANRSPDAAWILSSKWDNLTAEQRQKFLPLCPDFVIELRSASDKLSSLQRKMQEYQNNGTRLGWLINPQDKQIEIYRPGKVVEILHDPQTLSGEDVLPNFVLDLGLIW